MAIIPLSAKNAKVRIGANVHTSKQWNVKYVGDKLDISNFEGGGFKQYTGGLKGLDVTINFDWDAQAGGAAGGNPFDTGGNAIIPGTTISTVVLYTNDTTSAYWSMGSFYVEDVTITAEVKGLVSGTITGSASGSFQIPSGTTTTRTSP